MIVTRGQNEYSLSGNQVFAGVTGALVDRTSDQKISGSKTFASPIASNGLVISSGSGISVRSGVVIMPYVAKTGAFQTTGSYYVSSSDFTINCSGSFNIYLSGTNALEGRIINVKNLNSGHVDIWPAPSRIDGSTGNREVYSGVCLTLQADGLNWILI